MKLFNKFITTIQSRCVKHQRGNDIRRIALRKAGVPSKLELAGLLIDDGNAQTALLTFHGLVDLFLSGISLA